MHRRRVRRHGVRVWLRGYDDDELVGVRLFSACMAVPEDDQEALDQGDIGAQELEIPGVA